MISILSCQHQMGISLHPHSLSDHYHPCTHARARARTDTHTYSEETTSAQADAHHAEREVALHLPYLWSEWRSRSPQPVEPTSRLFSASSRRRFSPEEESGPLQLSFLPIFFSLFSSRPPPLIQRLEVLSFFFFFPSSPSSSANSSPVCGTRRRQAAWCAERNPRGARDAPRRAAARDDGQLTGGFSEPETGPGERRRPPGPERATSRRGWILARLLSLSLTLSLSPTTHLPTFSLSLPLPPSYTHTRTHILRPPLCSSRPPTAGAMPAHSDSRRRDPSLIATRRRSRFNRLHKTGERLALNSRRDPR